MASHPATPHYFTTRTVGCTFVSHTDKVALDSLTHLEQHRRRPRLQVRIWAEVRPRARLRQALLIPIQAGTETHERC